MTWFADLADKFLQEFQAGGDPNLAEHVQQHITASGDGESESEFEFGLGLILDGLKKARGMS